MTGDRKVVCSHTKSEKPYDWRAKSCSWSYEEAAWSKQRSGERHLKSGACKIKVAKPTLKPVNFEQM